MSDRKIIYADDAINALAEMYCKSDEDGYLWIIRSDAWSRIDTLPSAQPERCEDCENFSKTRLLIPQPEIIQNMGKWIPVSERLPKEEKMHYWVCTDTGYQCQCRWTNDVYGLGASDRWEWKIFDIPQYQKVVAWMPLPEPWRGEEE